VHTFTIEETSSSSEENSSPSDISPVSSAGPDQTVPFGSTVDFNGLESTGDNKIVSYEWDFNASNGIQSDAIGAVVNHTYETAGVYTVTLKVTDANGNTDCDTCTVTVLEKADDTVKAAAVVDVSSSSNNVIPGETFTVDLLIDPETAITGAQLDFVFNSSMASANGAKEGNLFKQNGAHTIFSGGTVDKSAGKIKNIYGLILGTSNVSSPGTMATINLTAGNSTGIAEFSLSNVLISDASSKSVSSTVTSATVLIDTAPVMNQICCPKSVDEKSTLTFMVSAKDADCDRLTLSTSELPEGACFNRTSGLFTWIPSIGQAGVYTFTFKVSDGYLTDSANVTVTVSKLNYLPVINYFEPLNGSFFSEGERINVSVNASDADGQFLNYSIKIDGVKCSTEPAYVWETDYSSSGNRTIEVAVSDGIDEVKEQHIIYINDYHPRWDVNEDGIVNILDITIIAQNYGTDTKKPYPRWDVNQDGVINIQDLTLAGYYFGEIVI
jgi:PKD repeat protein